MSKTWANALATKYVGVDFRQDYSTLTPLIIAQSDRDDASHVNLPLHHYTQLYPPSLHTVF